MNRLHVWRAPSESVCSICQDTVTYFAQRCMCCRQHYHRTCLSAWHATSRTCPCCRADMCARDTSAKSHAVWFPSAVFVVIATNVLFFVMHAMTGRSVYTKYALVRHTVPLPLYLFLQEQLVLYAVFPCVFELLHSVYRLHCGHKTYTDVERARASLRVFVAALHCAEVLLVCLIRAMSATINHP